MANLENKLSKAYEKVGKKIGSLHDIYNPESYEQNPINSSNWMSDQFIALTSSDFKNSRNPGFSMYEAYVSFDDIIPGSILINSYTTQVFMIINHEINHGINAMECFNAITISRKSSAYDGTGQTEVNYIVDLPCSISISGSDTSSSIISQSRSGSSHTHSATIRFQTIEQQDIRIGDIVNDDSLNQYEIMAVDYSSTGYKLVVNGLRP